ncbi:MAG: DUF1499 domain-containing protein [Gemmatimonas sp.]|nr:DUF1499 domain-containing protein [Gemmatimonas sp.]
MAVLGLAIIVALTGVMAGLGPRTGLWDFRTGFQILRWAAFGGIAVAILSVIALLVARPGGPRRGFTAAVVSLAIGLLAFGLPWQQSRIANSVPLIHDITTDTENPPEFVAVAPLRADAPNPIAYEGEEIARQQREGYPDLRPVLLELPMDRAFQRALDAAEAQGWDIIDANPQEGRIEATDRTFWFGFYDDVVIRLTPVNARTVVDIRSKSRVGLSDVGANARRIRGYIDDLEG